MIKLAKPKLPTYLAVVLTTIVTLGLGPSWAQSVEGIAAVVNDEVISRYDLNARLNMIIRSSNLRDTPELRQRLTRQVLQTLIDESLKMQEAKRLQIKVDDKEIEKAQRRIEKQNRLAPGGLQSFLKRQGIELFVLVQQIRVTLSWTKVLRRRAAGSIDVTDDEIAKALARINANLDKPSYRVSTILLIVDSPTDEARVRGDATRLVDEIRRGASFADIAQQFSHDASARRGGRLGWVQLGHFEKVVEDILVKMRPGEISRPIRSSVGYRIIALRSRRANSRTNVEETEVALRQILLPLPSTATPSEAAAQESLLRSVSGTITGCDDMTRAAKELGQGISAQLIKLKVRELPRDLRGIVLGLGVGRASKPVRTKAGTRILMVCQRKDPPARLPTPKSVRLMLLNQKAGLYSRRLLRDLRQTAFVDKRL